MILGMAASALEAIPAGGWGFIAIKCLLTVLSAIKMSFLEWGPRRHIYTTQSVAKHITEKPTLAFGCFYCIVDRCIYVFEYVW